MTPATMTQDRPAEGRSVPRRSRPPTPPGHRILHLVIDQETFDLLHLCALKSRMKYTAYMARFLKEAFPYSAPEGKAELAAAHDQGPAEWGGPAPGRGAAEARPIPSTPSPTEP